ncbi:Glyoxalase-like domain protein [Vibrio aerogenes CECT 7868]|uniref:Glyoxalase-like domain protein n=1 Tax=Vibrio aerogenes CECT 7868 TaxID=1216006 RepID=A0A1M6AN70_9VIBR|nr:VOC family protein [Vibrio aerogenes]SHI37940.1 Glyoxalase-like domain protein [Vibrio aerogenes CECT 7868]
MNNLVVLYVEDMMKSRQFYQALLNCEPEECSASFASFKVNASLSVGLWLRRDVKPDVVAAAGALHEICVFVRDHPALDRQYEHCTEIGATIIQEPVEMDFGRTFSVCDPDGCRIRYATPV